MTAISRRPLTAAAALVLLGAALAGALGLDAATPPLTPPEPGEGKEALIRFRQAEMARLRPAGSARPGPAGSELPEYYPPFDPDPPIDVLHYDIVLNVEPADSVVTGTTTIQGEVTEDGLAALVFDYRGAAVGSVALDGAPAAYTWIDGRITIPLDPPRLFHDDFTVEVTHGGVSTRGFYFPSDRFPASIASFTFSEPEDARWWFPCRDVPDDKVTFDLDVTVPAGHVVASSGELVVDETLPSGRRRFVWRETTPIASYLISVATAPYAIIHDTRHPAIPMVHYVYPADSAAAVTTFEPIPEMLDFFATVFGPYPFAKYGHAEASFPGGMEHQSLSLVGEFVVRLGAEYEWLLAHELAHQWWGDALTPRDWRHIWLNEGFASYGDALWFEYKEGRAGLNRRMTLFGDLFKLGYLQNGYAIPVLNPPAEHLFSFSSYDKGAWVLHMLRRVTGDEAFFTILRQYQEAHRYGNVVSDDFQAMAEAVYGDSLDWFFDPWLNDTGLPRYRLGWNSTALGDGRHRLDVTVEQTQPGIVYRMPVDFEFRSSAGAVRQTLVIDRTPQQFMVEIQGTPLDTAVVLDPDNWILKTVTRGDVTPVTLLDATATAGPAGVTIRWRVAEEARRHLFRVHRESPGGGRRPLDDRPRSGDLSYEVVDAAPPAGGADYWLEEIDPSGATLWHGPLRARLPEGARLVLAPVTPNPVRDQAAFAWSQAAPGRTTLDLFDTAGRRVRRLLDEDRPAGAFRLAWDARDDAGRPVAAGVYFARLATGADRQVTRLVVRR